MHPRCTLRAEAPRRPRGCTASSAVPSFTIITRAIITRGAKDASGDVHDRMPAFLDEEFMAEWLAPGKLEKDERAHLHGALGVVSETIAASLVTHPVDRVVNNVRTLDRNDSGLIAPIELS